MAAMLRIYCRDHHPDVGRDAQGLCSVCAELMTYAQKRLALCPFGSEKPTCANCQIHCYGRRQREQFVSMYQKQATIYPRAVKGLVRHLALGLRLADAAAVLRPALAAVGRPPGRAVRPGGAALLHLRPAALSAGPDLPGGAAGAVGAGLVLLHRRGRPPVVRLHLPADGLHRDLHVGRTPDRRRPHRAHAAGPGNPGARTRSCARAPSRAAWLAIACSPASASSATSRRSGSWPPPRRPGHVGAGTPSGSCSTAPPPTAMRASCASRCASTCAPTHASRAR
jgi:hypothetical protein